MHSEQAGLENFGASLQLVYILILPTVALNFQTPGPEMDVYLGRFQDNGACGYVLKPAFLRDPNTTFNSRALTQGPWWARKRLRVRVWPDTEGTDACGDLSCSLPSLNAHCPHLSLDHLGTAAAKSQQE